MQISTLRISDGLLLSWREKHPPCWVSPKHCIFFPSLVNKTVESTGKPRSQHFSTLLNLGLERLRFGEQHNPSKNLPCITVERQDHDNSVDPQSYQEVEAQPGRKHPHHAKTKLLPRTAPVGEKADMGETEGNMRHSALIPLKIHGKILSEWKYPLGSKLLCIFGHPLLGTVLPSLVKWWLVRGKRRQSTYLDSALPPWGFLHRSSWPEHCLCSSSHRKQRHPAQPP